MITALLISISFLNSIEIVTFIEKKIAFGRSYFNRNVDPSAASTTRSCKLGSFMDGGGECKKNVCVCPMGTPAAGDECLANGRFLCTECVASVRENLIKCPRHPAVAAIMTREPYMNYREVADEHWRTKLRILALAICRKNVSGATITEKDLEREEHAKRGLTMQEFDTIQRQVYAVKECQHSVFQPITRNSTAVGGGF